MSKASSNNDKQHISNSVGHTVRVKPLKEKEKKED